MIAGYAIDPNDNILESFGFLNDSKLFDFTINGTIDGSWVSLTKNYIDFSLDLADWILEAHLLANGFSYAVTNYNSIQFTYSKVPVSQKRKTEQSLLFSDGSLKHS